MKTASNTMHDVTESLTDRIDRDGKEERPNENPGPQEKIRMRTD